MAIQLASGASADVATVDATSKALRGTPYGTNGSVAVPLDRAAIVPGAQPGQPIEGADYKVARVLRCSSFGTLRVSDESLFLYDAIEGAAVDTNKWIQTTTTMTITQAVSTGMLFNANSTATTTTGAMHTSHRKIPFVFGAPIVIRVKARLTAHFNNNLVEIGFGNPATATAAALGDGAVWRKDGTGQVLPVVSINGSEVLGTPISNATFVAAVGTGDYGIFEIMLEQQRARFNLYTQAGVLVNAQDLDFTATSPTLGVTHVNAMTRTYNSGATTAVQLFVAGVAVTVAESMGQRPWTSALAGQSNAGVTSPTAYTQTANYSNSAAPTTRTLTNTTAVEATLGGLLRANALAGANVDYVMFGFTVPTPYTFYFTGIKIPVPMNEVAAVATTDTILSYGLAFNSSAVSLATAGVYPPMRIALAGIHKGTVALAANTLFTGNDIVWQPTVPIAVQPGRFFHVICRAIVGTATATETFLWAGVTVDGYFE